MASDRASREQPQAEQRATAASGSTSRSQPFGPRGPATGLCGSCVFQRRVPNTRGSVFSLCERSRDDPTFARYPRLPVLDCSGYEQREK